MESTNPYQSPAADVSALPNHGYDESNPFSSKGRFGRMSYLAWGMLLALPLWIVSAIIGVKAGLSGAGTPPTIQPVFVIMEILYIFPMIMFAIRRLHDFDASGWWALLLIVPFVNALLGLVLLFRSGSEGSNRFGHPRLTRGWEKVMGSIGIGFLILAVIGIIAAIAIPAYTAAHAIH